MVIILRFLVFYFLVVAIEFATNLSPFAHNTAPTTAWAGTHLTTGSFRFLPVVLSDIVIHFSMYYNYLIHHYYIKQRTIRPVKGKKKIVPCNPLFIIVKTWKQPKHLSMDEWIKTS